MGEERRVPYLLWLPVFVLSGSLPVPQQILWSGPDSFSRSSCDRMFSAAGGWTSRVTAASHVLPLVQLSSISECMPGVGVTRRLVGSWMIASVPTSILVTDLLDVSIFTPFFVGLIVGYLATDVLPMNLKLPQTSRLKSVCSYWALLLI